MPSRSSRRTTATPSRTPPLRPCCRASVSGDSSSSAHRPMRASARRSTVRSSGGTTRPLSATPTRRRTRSSPTRTCTGNTRRRRGGRPGRLRHRTSTSAARPNQPDGRVALDRGVEGRGGRRRRLTGGCPRNAWSWSLVAEAKFEARPDAGEDRVCLRLGDGARLNGFVEHALCGVFHGGLHSAIAYLFLRLEVAERLPRLQGIL